MVKKYTIFAVKNATETITVGTNVERTKATIDASDEISFVATDGLKMFIVGDAESLSGIKPSDTGFGSTCGATPAKVQELAEILTSMGYSVDVTIAYAAIDKISVYPEKANVTHESNEEKYKTCYEFTVSSVKENMVEKALELAAEIGNAEDESDAFVVMCEFYLKSNKG